MHNILHSSNILMAILADVLEHAQNPAIVRHLDKFWQAVQLPLSTTVPEVLTACSVIGISPQGWPWPLGKHDFEELSNLHRALTTSPYGFVLVC